MEAEMLAIAIGWQLGDSVITDSRAAIGRGTSLQFDPPRGCIEVMVVRAATREKKSIAWVKRHSGVMGNELAGLEAKKVL